MAITRRVSSSGGFAGPGGFLDRRFAAEILQQLAGDVPHARHGLDHVHRDADRAALVGHGAGDRLANPPGGVGAELEPAAIFELIDRPHQARVPLLDQVQEAQAAVAVLLGDRNHQAQVAFGQSALGFLVLGDRLPCRYRTRLRRLVGVSWQARRMLRNSMIQGFALLGRQPPAFSCSSIRAFSSSTRRLKSSSVLIHGSIRWVRRPEFFDQLHGTAPAAPQSPPGGLALGRAAATCWWPRNSRDGSASSGRPGSEVVGQPAEDLLLLQAIGHRDLHGAVEGQFAVVTRAAACARSAASRSRIRRPCGGTSRG